MTRIIIRYYDPSYPYLLRAIASVPENLEILVYDDGSTQFPDFETVLRRCQVRRALHQGPASTLIRALTDAWKENVQQVFILDGDDTALPNLANFLDRAAQLPYTAVIGQFRSTGEPIYHHQGIELFHEALSSLRFSPPCFSLKPGSWVETLPAVLEQVQTEYLGTGTLFLGLFLAGQTGISLPEQVVIWQQHEAQTYRHHHQERFLAGERIKLIYNHKLIQDYTAAIARDPQDAIAYYNRGNAWMRLGDRQAAIANYTNALQLRPNLAQAYSNRGMARAELGEVQGAIADYSQAIQLKPDYAEAYFNRGNLYSSLGDLERARPDFQQATQWFAKQGDLVHYRQALAATNELVQL